MLRQRCTIWAVLFATTGLVGSTQAGSAYLTLTINVDASRTTAEEWYEPIRTELMAAGNCKIIEENTDSQFTASTRTPLGLETYVMDVEMEREAGKTIYTYTMKESLQGQLANQKIRLTFTETANGTEVTVEMYTKVDSKLAPSFIVKQVVQSCLDGIESFIIENAPTGDRAGDR